MIPDKLAEYLDSVLSDNKQRKTIGILTMQYCKDHETELPEVEQLPEEMQNYVILARNFSKIKLHSQRINAEVMIDDSIKPKERPLYQVDLDLIDQYAMIYLGTDSLDVQIYKAESELFAYMLNAIYDSIIADTELLLWRNASGRSAASIERMFALKAKRPEYKENSSGTADQLTKLNITINGSAFQVDTETQNQKAISKPEDSKSSEDTDGYKTSALKDLDLELDDL